MALISLDDVRSDPRYQSAAPTDRARFEENYLKAHGPELLHEAATQAGVPKDIATKMVHFESGWDPKAVSPKGAIGLMQIMPATAKELGIDPHDPQQNLTGGTRYLSSLLKKFGDIPQAVAAYNAGPGRIETLIKRFGPEWQSHLPEETRKYVENVTGLRKSARVPTEQAIAAYNTPRRTAENEQYLPKGLESLQARLAGPLPAEGPLPIQMQVGLPTEPDFQGPPAPPPIEKLGQIRQEDLRSYKPGPPEPMAVENMPMGQMEQYYQGAPFPQYRKATGVGDWLNAAGHMAQYMLPTKLFGGPSPFTDHGAGPSDMGWVPPEASGAEWTTGEHPVPPPPSQELAPKIQPPTATASKTSPPPEPPPEYKPGSSYGPSDFRYEKSQTEGAGTKSENATTPPKAKANAPKIDERKKVYTSIANEIHPDRAAGDGSAALRNRLTQELNDLYRKGGTAKQMQAILNEWRESPFGQGYRPGASGESSSFVWPPGAERPPWTSPTAQQQWEAPVAEMQGYALPPKRPSWTPPLAQEQWATPQTQDTGYGLPPPKPQWEAPRAQQQWEAPRAETRGYALNEPPPKIASPTEPQPLPRAEEAAPLPEQPVATPLSSIKVYHGTDQSFEKFDPQKIGSRTDPGFTGRGAYVTIDPEKAGRWGQQVLSTDIRGGKWLEIKNQSDLYKNGLLQPLSPEESQLPQGEIKKIFAKKVDAMTKNLIGQGYDGVKWKMSSGDTQYTLFHPEEYKFSEHSKGTTSLPEQPVAPPAKTEPTATKRSDPQRITKYKGYELRTKAPHVQTGRYMKGWDIYKDGKLVTSSDASLGEVKKKVDAFPEFRIIESPSPIADSLKAVASGKEPAFSNASRKTFEKLAGQKYATDKELARAVLEKMDDGKLGPKLKRPSPKKKPTSSR